MTTAAAVQKPGGTRWALVPTHVLDSLPDAQTRALLTHLAGLADRDGIAFQSHERMAAALGISPATLYRWQARLEASGHAVRIGGGHKGRIVRWAVTALQTAAAAAQMAAAHAARMAARRLFRAQDAVRRGMGEVRREGAYWKAWGYRQRHSLSPVRPDTAKDELLTGYGAQHMPRNMQMDALESPDLDALIAARVAQLDAKAAQRT